MAPAEAVRLAKALFPVRPVPKRITRILAELIFDSHLAPTPAGIRSIWNIGWQCLYRAGDCFLDLRIEPEPDTSRAAIIGQISNRKVTAVELSDIMVCLKSGRSIVGETRSNRFGEFQLEYEQQQRLQLLVYLDAGSRCIQVPLKKIAPERPASTERLPSRPRPGSAYEKSE